MTQLIQIQVFAFQEAKILVYAFTEDFCGPQTGHCTSRQAFDDFRWGHPEASIIPLETRRERRWHADYVFCPLPSDKFPPQIRWDKEAYLTQRARSMRTTLKNVC